MPWLATDKNKREWIYLNKPARREDCWNQTSSVSPQLNIPTGSIEKLIGKKLTWDDDPVEIK